MFAVIKKSFLAALWLVIVFFPGGAVCAAEESEKTGDAQKVSPKEKYMNAAAWNEVFFSNEGDGLCEISIINPAAGRDKITDIYFFVWSDEGYKNDLYRYRGIKTSNEKSGIWSARFNANTHGSSGLYCVEIKAVCKGKELLIRILNFRNDFTLEKHHGWVEKNGNYYFYDRKKQVMKRGGVQDGITIKDDGTAVLTDYSSEKLPVMVRAAEVIDEICEPDDSLSEKKDKCYEYVVSFPYLLKDYGVGDYVGKWNCLDAHYANNILNAYGDQAQCGGECVAEAAALAYLFAELDFGEVYLYTNEVHGWVYADGRYYDPNNSAVNGRAKWFNTSTYVTYATNTYMIN